MFLEHYFSSSISSIFRLIFLSYWHQHCHKFTLRFVLLLMIALIRAGTPIKWIMEH